MPTCCSVAPSSLLSRAQRHTWRKKAHSRGDLSKVLLEATRRTNSSRSTAASAGASLPRGTGTSARPIWVRPLIPLTKYHIFLTRERGGSDCGGHTVEPRVYTCNHCVSALRHGDPEAGMAARVASVTRPVVLPLSICAHAGDDPSA